MATVKDLLQMIAGKEVMIFDLKEAMTKLQTENESLQIQLDKHKPKPKKSNGKEDAATIANESTKPAGG